jgi:fructokinase
LRNNLIICCGEALIDFIPMPGGLSYRPCPGGSILNIAVGLGRLQVPVSLLSRLSTDMFGDLLAEYLEKNNVSLEYCPRVKGQTTLAFVSLPSEAAQEPQFAFYANGGVDRSLTINDLPVRFGTEVEALHFGSISLLLEPGASALEDLMKRESRQRLLTLDPNVRPALITDKEAFKIRFLKWISLVDILRLSAADLEFLYPHQEIGKLLAQWFGNGLSLVILTRGAEGVSAYNANGTEVFVPAQKVQVKDTVGAGDSFFSAALAWLHDHGLLSQLSALDKITPEELKACLTFAGKAAAINCTREGANPPFKSEMEDQ